MTKLAALKDRAEKAERLLEIERECREAWAAKCDARTERLSVAESRVKKLEDALEELADHHCGGVCAENEAARGYRPHGEVMAQVAAALSTAPGATNPAGLGRGQPATPGSKQ